jgi:hypothetical protein
MERSFIWEVSFNPIFTDNDEIEGACCFVHDITKRKERENVVYKSVQTTSRDCMDSVA